MTVKIISRRPTTDPCRAALDGRVPENALLSHDLFEGLYARTALVTDIEVVDDYPASVLVHARLPERELRRFAPYLVAEAPAAQARRT